MRAPDDLLPDRPPWSEPSREDLVPLPAHVDVCVIGGGLAGLEIARRLRSKAASVLVLEGRARPGEGTVARDPGVLTGGLPEHPWRLVEAIGEARTRQLYDLSDRSLQRVEALVGEVEPCVHAAIDERELGELDRSSAALAALGKQVERLDAADTCAAIGGEGFTGGMRVLGEGGVDTHQLVLNLARRVRTAGVVIASHTEAQRLAQDAQGHLIRTSRGTVRADAVVITGGIGAVGVLPWLQDKLVPVREHAIRIPSHPRVAPGRAQYGYVSWRAEQEHVLVSGCRWATQHMEVQETVEQPRQVVVDKIVGFARSHLLADGAPTHAWARILTATCDGLPITGPFPGDPTIVVCTGFQGFGASLALAAGRDVAEGMLTGTSPLPHWLAPQRFL